ncbi:MAG: hypothetical protein Q8736_02430, partial [Sweet potato little leaf phytoplasma]|nr:hypothetical protein [Sweet potato little leaf phytoplasma]
KILKGIDLLANTVKITLGPKGQNVLLEQKYGSPLIINDGIVPLNLFNSIFFRSDLTFVLNLTVIFTNSSST